MSEGSDILASSGMSNMKICEGKAALDGFCADEKEGAVAVLVLVPASLRKVQAPSLHCVTNLISVAPTYSTVQGGECLQVCCDWYSPVKHTSPVVAGGIHSAFV